MMSQTKKLWIGTAPARCQLCLDEIKDSFVDGKTCDGRWAFMCTNCHAEEGYGLGTGKGQKYTLQPDGTWEKVEG